MSDEGKTMNEGEREELAGRIVDESQDVIVRAMKEGMFVLRLSSNIATGHV